MAILTNGDVAAQVRAVAAIRRVRQAQLADQLKISRMAMSRRFTGEKPFEPEELIRIARELDVAVSTFFGEEVNEEVRSPRAKAGAA